MAYKIGRRGPQRGEVCEEEAWRKVRKSKNRDRK
jgi:hypothetical protein